MTPYRSENLYNQEAVSARAENKSFINTTGCDQAENGYVSPIYEPFPDSPHSSPISGYSPIPNRSSPYRSGFDAERERFLGANIAYPYDLSTSPHSIPESYRYYSDGSPYRLGDESRSPENSYSPTSPSNSQFSPSYSAP